MRVDGKAGLILNIKLAKLHFLGKRVMGEDSKGVQENTAFSFK